MNVFTSYLRHLLVIGILFLVEKWKLPIDGSEDAANWIALSFVGTLTWIVSKYGSYIASRFKGGANLFLLSIALAGITLGLSSCTPQQRENVLRRSSIEISSEQYGIGGTYSSKGGLDARVDVDKLRERIDRNSGK